MRCGSTSNVQRSGSVSVESDATRAPANGAGTVGTGSTATATRSDTSKPSENSHQKFPVTDDDPKFWDLVKKCESACPELREIPTPILRAFVMLGEQHKEDELLMRTPAKETKHGR